MPATTLSAAHPNVWARMHATAVYKMLQARTLAKPAKVDRRYLPYLDPDHPLLKELEVKAYGTFQHVVKVGSIAAAAAFRVNGNPDLARIIGYYHDIGKLSNPQLFLESRPRGQSREIACLDDLRKIMGHPLESRRLLELSGFPPEVCLAVGQHHGNVQTRVRLTPEVAALVTEADLQYAGPIPGTIEAAIVMYADNTEAVCEKMRGRGGWPEHPTLDFITGIATTIGIELRDGRQFADGIIPQIKQTAVGNYIAWWLYRYYNGLNVLGSPERPDPEAPE